MWIVFALAAALGSAGTSFALKRTVEHAGAVVSTVTFRILAGLLLLCVVYNFFAAISSLGGLSLDLEDEGGTEE